MTPRNPVPIALFLAIASSLAAQTTGPADITFPGVPLPAGPCPSVLEGPPADGAPGPGVFELATERPAVVDGDTIRVKGLDESLRLVCIDTEETFKDAGLRRLAARDWTEYLRTVNAGHRPARPPKYGTEMGEAARDFAHRFFDGVTTVRLEYDDPGRRRGYFDRHLVHALARKDGRWVHFNVEVVRQGLSPYFVKYGWARRHHARFLEAEKEARDLGRGIWDAEPSWRAYPDYRARLAWWIERANDLTRLEEMRARGDVLLLGVEEDWSRLRRMKGREVTVAGVPSRVLLRDSVGIVFLAHKNRRDFAIAGPPDAVGAHPLTQEEGNHVLVTGRVSLHRGRPRFRLEDVKRWTTVPR